MYEGNYDGEISANDGDITGYNSEAVNGTFAQKPRFMSSGKAFDEEGSKSSPI